MKQKASVLTGLAFAAAMVAFSFLQPYFREPASSGPQGPDSVYATEAAQTAATNATATNATVTNATATNATAATASGEAKTNATQTNATAATASDETKTNATKTNATKTNATAATASDATNTANAAKSAGEQSSPIAVPKTAGIVPGGHIRAKVIRIVDGDTIKAEYEGKEYRVRLLCIDTPETVKEGVAAQSYGKEASNKLSALLLDHEVTLVFDKEVEDAYERLLAYVMLEDGSCANAVMVGQGFARVDIVKPNTTYRSFFNELQEAAIKEGRGFWALPEKDRPFVENKNGDYIPRYYKDAA